MLNFSAGRRAESYLHLSIRAGFICNAFLIGILILGYGDRVHRSAEYEPFLQIAISVL